MKFKGKYLAYAALMGLIYILLGIGSVYTNTWFILFPIVAAPLALLLIRMDASGDFFEAIFHIACFMGIYLSTSNIGESLLYMINVAVPAHVMARLYKKNMPFSVIVMYTAAFTITSMFLVFAYMKYTGVDYIKYWITQLDQVKQLYFDTLDKLVLMNGKIPAKDALTYSIASPSTEEIKVFKDAMEEYLNTIKIIYPAIFLYLGVLLSILQITLISIVAKLKKWHMPKSGHIFNFRISKIAFGLLVLAVIMMAYQIQISNIWFIIASNVFFFLNNLFLITGVISFIILLKRSKVGSLYKIISAILFAVSFFMLPSLVILMGFFDTLFNFRKTDVVV